MYDCKLWNDSFFFNKYYKSCDEKNYKFSMKIKPVNCMHLFIENILTEIVYLKIILWLNFIIKVCYFNILWWGG